jgi:predicted ThiF/HesA family dinucleotide-utilizing enzyme
LAVCNGSMAWLGAARIRQARVAVVGIGGVGSWAAEALARSGVGQLVLIDLDHVAESNINRQAHALSTTIGQAKVRAMQERIALIHPQCQVACIEAFVEPGNWPQLLDGPVHAVIDACDQVSAKVAMAAWARQGGKGFITVGAAGGKRLAHEVDIDDLSRSDTRSIAGPIALSVAQAPRCAPRGQDHWHPQRVQPGAGCPAGCILCRRGRRFAQLPRLRFGRQRHRHFWSVCGRLGSRFSCQADVRAMNKTL